MKSSMGWGRFRLVMRSGRECSLTDGSSLVVRNHIDVVRLNCDPFGDFEDWQRGGLREQACKGAFPAGSRCWITTNAMPVSGESLASNARTASNPPAEAPIATMGIATLPDRRT